MPGQLAACLTASDHMWLPGHLAVAFLACLPILYLTKRDRLLSLAYLAFFSQLPDFLHFEDLRMFSHSIFGLTILLLLGISVFWVVFRPRPSIIAISILATPLHLLADLYVGSINPFYPWSKEWMGYHTFNTPFDIELEVLLLGISFIVFLALFKPMDLLRSARVQANSARTQILLLLTPFGAITAFEGGYFVLTSFNHGIGLARAGLALSFLTLFGIATIVILLIMKSIWKEFGTRPFDDKYG